MSIARFAKRAPRRDWFVRLAPRCDWFVRLAPRRDWFAAAYQHFQDIRLTGSLSLTVTSGSGDALCTDGGAISGVTSDTTSTAVSGSVTQARVLRKYTLSIVIYN